MALPQTWDEVGALWDAPGNVWEPPPPSALLAGSLLGTATLGGTLLLGVVALEGPLRGTATLAGQLRTGVVLTGALVGSGLAGGTLLTGALFVQTLRGTGILAGAFFVPPSGALLAGALRGIALLTGLIPSAALTVPHLFGPDSPYAETPHLDENFDALLAQINRPNALGIGPLANRPAPGHQGAMYVATDSNDEWWMDDGLTWRSMGAFGAANMVVHDLATDNLLLLGAPTGPPGATRVLTAAKATVVPTKALPDGAVLYVGDVQGQPGTAAWHHLSEGGVRTPLDPVLFRQGFQTFQNTAAQVSLLGGGRLIKGGTLPGRYLEVWWRGDVSTPVAGRTLSMILWYNFVLVSINLTAIPVVSFAPLHTLYRLDCLTGAVQLGLPVSILGQGPVSVTVANGAVDATVDQYLDVGATMSVADPAFQLRTFAATMTLR